LKAAITTEQKLGSLILILLLGQILVTALYTGQQMLFNSGLRLRFSSDYFLSEKVTAVLGGPYQLAQQWQDLPRDANYLIIYPVDAWFANYYLFPRRLFRYEGATAEADFKNIPREWLAAKKIEYVIYYLSSGVRVEKLAGAAGGK
jgi:hypothetical protein